MGDGPITFTTIHQTHCCMHLCAFCGIQDNMLHKRFLSDVVFQSRSWFLKNEYCFTSLSVQSWQYRDRRKPETGTMPYSHFEWLQGFFIVHSIPQAALYTPGLWTVWSTVYAQPRRQISDQTGIRTCYLQVISPSRYEWAIGAGRWYLVWCYSGHFDFFMIHVVMSLEVSCVYRIPWYRKHVVWWNKLVSTQLLTSTC